MAKKIVVPVEMKGGENVEKTVNAFTKLTKEIKTAKGELAKFEVGTAGYKKASAALNELQEKLGDVTDAAKITGNGFERIQGSFSLFKESLNTADFGKAKAAFSGLGAAMKAIPIFLIIEGIKFLVEKFDELKNSGGLLGTVFKAIGTAIEWVTGKIEEFTNWIGLTNTEIEKQGKAQLENAKIAKAAAAERSAQYDRQIAEAKALGKNTVELEKAKQDAIIATSKAVLDQTMAQIKANAANGIAITQEQRDLMNQQLEDIKAAASAKRVIENTAKKDTLDKQKETNNEYRKNQQDINKTLAGLAVDAINDNQARETAALNQKFADLKKEFIEKKASKDQLAELEKDHLDKLKEINEKYIQEELEKENKLILDKAALDNKETDEYIKRKTLEAQRVQDAEIKTKENQVLNAKKGSSELLTLQKELLALQTAKQKEELDKQALQQLESNDKYLNALKEVKEQEEEIEKANRLNFGGEDKEYTAFLINELATRKDNLEKVKQEELDTNSYINSQKLNADIKYYSAVGKLQEDAAKEQKKQQEDAAKAQIAGISKTLSTITGLFSQFSSSITGIYQTLNETDDYNRDIQLRKLEDAYDERIDAINDKKEEELYNLENYNKQTLAGEKATLDAMLENQNLSAEEKALLQEASAARETQIKIDFENAKAQIQYEADKAEYDAKLAQFEAEEKLKKEAFDADKRMKIAQIVISTITGAVAAFTGMLQSIPAPYGLIAGAIAAASVAAMGATQAAAVASTQYQKGQAPKEPQPPRVQIGAGAGLSGAGAGSATPSLKDSTLYGTGGGQTGSQVGAQSRQQVDVGPVRAYVLLGDIVSEMDAEAQLRRKVTGF